MYTSDTVYNMLIKNIDADPNNLSLSDVYAFKNTNKRLSRRSTIGWEFVKIFLEEIEKAGVIHCIYFGSLIGLLRYAHEQPHMDDWDIIIPNDSANITRLHAALKKLKNIFGEAFKCGYAHGHTIFGMNMFIRLPITPYSKDNEEKNQAWALAQLDVFFVDISDGTIRWPRGQRQHDSKAIGNASVTWPVPRNEGESSSLIFPAIKANIKNYNVYLPPIAFSNEFLAFMNRGYQPSPVEHIHIISHFRDSINIKLNNQESKPYLEAFYRLEDKAMEYINIKATESNCKSWKDINLPSYDSSNIFPINCKNYFKLLPDVLSVIDSLTKDGKCSIPAKLVFFAGDIILYRPTIHYKIYGKLRSCDKAFFNIIHNSNNNLITKREQILEQCLPIDKLSKNALRLADPSNAKILQNKQLNKKIYNISSPFHQNRQSITHSINNIFPMRASHIKGMSMKLHR